MTVPVEDTPGRPRSGLDAIGGAGGTSAFGRHRAAGAGVRVAPGRSSARALWIAAVLAGLVVAGWSWLGRPAVAPVSAGAGTIAAPAAPSPGVAAAGAAPVAEPAAQPTVPPTVVVAVVGQVGRPGVVTLPAGSRVADALAAAGGLLPEADPASINAAALLTDGQQVAVGVPAAAETTGASVAGPVAGGLLDLNTASVPELDALPGLGPVLAQRIVDHRSQSGPFTSVDQLDDVPGIGPTLYAGLAPLVTV